MTRYRCVTVALTVLTGVLAACSTPTAGPELTSTSTPAGPTTSTPPAADPAPPTGPDDGEHNHTEPTEKPPAPLGPRRPAITTDPAQLARRYAAEYLAGVPIPQLIELADDAYGRRLFIGIEDDNRPRRLVQADPALNTGNNIWIVPLTTWDDIDEPAPEHRVVAVTVAQRRDRWVVANLTVEL